MPKMGATDRLGATAKRRFTDEFKDGAVRLVLDEGKTVAEAARSLGLTPSSLRVFAKFEIDSNFLNRIRWPRRRSRFGRMTNSEPMRVKIMNGF